MQSAASEKPKMWGIGFGSYRCMYDSGREGDMPLIGSSPGKAATVLCNITGFSDSEALLAQLGKHTTGKGCLYIKTLADVDQIASETLVVKSFAAMRARYPSTTFQPAAVATAGLKMQATTTRPDAILLHSYFRPAAGGISLSTRSNLTPESAWKCNRPGPPQGSARGHRS